MIFQFFFNVECREIEEDINSKFKEMKNDIKLEKDIQGNEK